MKTTGDLAAAVEVISALHQRFGPGEFTSYLGWLLGRGLSTPDKVQLKALSQDAREKEEKERMVRQRALLKVVTELWLVGVLRSLDDIARPEDAAAKGKENVGLGASKLGEAVGKPRVGQGQGKTDRSLDAEPFPYSVLEVDQALVKPTFFLVLPNPRPLCLTA